MQNTMLDSVVSSHSQAQPLNFDLNAVHNGEACIASLDPKDERENKFWFTIAMFCTIYGVAEQTIRDNLKSLVDDGEIGLPEISGRRINIEDSCGVPHPTTIYNLTVLNQLAMAEMNLSEIPTSSNRGIICSVDSRVQSLNLVQDSWANRLDVLFEFDYKSKKKKRFGWLNPNRLIWSSRVVLE